MLGGCGSKMPLQLLQPILDAVMPGKGIDGLVDDFGDAAVVQVPGSDQLSVVTVDFGTPVSNSPTEWGRIAAQNALSDIYAVGGTPLVALSILGWPRQTDVVDAAAEDVVQAASDQVRRAGAAIVGGHSLSADVPFFGLAVVGVASENSVMGNGLGRPGDYLALTKPLGSGLASALRKAGLISDAAWTEAVAWMLSSNRTAAMRARQLGIRLSTDVTGYGMLGHAHLVGHRSGVAVELWPDERRTMFAVAEARAAGHVPPAAEAQMIQSETFRQGPAPAIESLLTMCDPQSSGGLLLGGTLGQITALRQQMPDVTVVGRLMPGSKGMVSFANSSERGTASET